jgi:predicted small lipoprotein YifL
MLRRLLILALIVALTAPLAACGRKGAPVPLEGSEYPRKYPAE